MRLKKRKKTHTHKDKRKERNKRYEIRLSKFLDWQREKREKVVPRRNKVWNVS